MKMRVVFGYISVNFICIVSCTFVDEIGYEVNVHAPNVPLIFCIYFRTKKLNFYFRKHREITGFC